MTNFAIMGNKGIIEDFHSLDEAFESTDRVREDNNDIEGDLKIIEIHGVER